MLGGHRMVLTLRACCAADDSLLGRQRNDNMFAEQSGEDFPIFFFSFVEKVHFLLLVSAASVFV